MWVGGRGNKRRNIEVVNLNVVNGVWVPTLGTNYDLAIVGLRTYKMDGYVVCQDEAREVEKLVEVPLCRERHHNHLHLGWMEHVTVVAFLIMASVVGSHW